MMLSKKVAVLLGVLVLAGCTANKPRVSGEAEGAAVEAVPAHDGQIKMYIYPSSGKSGSQGYFLEFDVEPDSQETVRYRG